MARKKSDQSIGDALKQFIRAHNLQGGIDRIDVREAWQRLMGPGVNKYTKAVELKGEVLYVYLDSSVLREELSLGKSKIIAMINEELGKDLVKKLVLS